VVIDAVIDLEWTRRKLPVAPDDFFIQPADIADEIWRRADQPRGAWSSTPRSAPSESNGSGEQDARMGHTQAGKVQTHDRIVRIAARRIREDGLDALSIGDVMKEAGLTHGGFYKHFASREDLVAEALASAIADSQAAAALARSGLDGLVGAYLSCSHRDDPGGGCAVGALASEAGRAAPAVRELYTEQVRRNLQGLQAVLPDGPAARSGAILALSAMVGAIGLSRAVTDPALADEILEAVRERLGASLGRAPG
jgi:TetR/AcrR family transcriptional repressor of nem operon